MSEFESKTSKGQKVTIKIKEGKVLLASNVALPINHVIALEATYRANKKDFVVDGNSQLVFTNEDFLKIIGKLKDITGYVHTERSVSVKK